MILEDYFCFSTKATKDFYVLRDHCVHNVNIMPGVTFISMIYQLLDKKGIQYVNTRLNNVFFNLPVAVSDDFSKQINLHFKRNEGQSGTEQWQIEGRSIMVYDDGTTGVNTDLNVSGELLFDGIRPNKPIDIHDLKSKATAVYDMDEVYGLARNSDINHYDFMKVDGTAYKGTDYILGDLRLSGFALNEPQDFILHPALLDSSTIVALKLALEYLDAFGTYIPMYISSFKVSGTLQKECHVYIHKDSISFTPSRDIVYCDIDLYDSHGNLAAQFVRIGMKKVREPGLIKRLVSADTGGSTNSEPYSTKRTFAEHNLEEDSFAARVEANSEGTCAEISSAEDTSAQDSSIEDEIKSIISKVIKKDSSEIKNNTGFYEQGLDSSNLLQVASALEEKLGEKLYPTLLFEYSNVDELSNYMRENYSAKFKSSRQLSQKPFKKQYEGSVAVNKPGIQKDDIAIIGMSGMFPGAGDVYELWENLKLGKDCIREIPKERWDLEGFYSPDKNEAGMSYSKWGGFIEDVDKFDPLFFGISPREAELMDPQERLFLLTAWKTMEDAGYRREDLKKRPVGVFVGVMYSEYQLVAANGLDKGKAAPVTTFSSSIANRASYFFDLHGPSISLDTMCSSSISAIHFACESILRGDCSMALAGGVNVSVHPNKYLYLSQARFLSSEGKCRSFGEGGDGFVPGEGVGAVLLKPLSQAVEDGDNIYGVIKATVLNHGGKTSGFTVPNPNAQAQLIESALKKSGINPRTISYIESHGTGTSLGDPIEIAGLGKAFRPFTKDVQYCSIGSVKSNIGHLESAAGIAGVIKILLQMKYGKLVPSIHSEKLNSKINFHQSPFYVQSKYEEWEKPEISLDGQTAIYPRRAGISSFGAGGSNGHIIIEEYEPVRQNQPIPENQPCLFVLSAKNEEVLKDYAHKFDEFLNKIDELPDKDCFTVRNITYTLQTGREAMEERLAFKAVSLDDICLLLKKFINDEDDKRIYRGNPNSIIKKDKVYGFDQGQVREHMPKTLEIDSLAGFWVSGGDMDFSVLYNESEIPCKLRLPPYPFQLKSYWIPEDVHTKTSAMRNDVYQKLHPLIYKNVSTLKEQKFSSFFSQNDFFVRDHIIYGEKLLPGVVYIEMARFAGEYASESPVGKMKNIVWAKPVSFQSGHKEIQTMIYPGENDLKFEIASIHGSERTTHAQGTIESITRKCEKETVSINEIKSRCSKEIDREQFYGLFSKMGFDYGASFKVIKEIHANQKECLSLVEVPVECEDSFDSFLLHPCIMDGALQTCMALIARANGYEPSPLLPFSIGEIEIFQKTSGRCYVYVKLLSRHDASPDTEKFDILVMNQNGCILSSINGFTARRGAKTYVDNQLVYIKPDWLQKDISKNGQNIGNVIVFDVSEGVGGIGQIREKTQTTLVKPSETFSETAPNVYGINPKNPEDFKKLFTILKQNGLTINHIVFLWPEAASTIPGHAERDVFELCAFAVLNISKALMDIRQGGKIRLVCPYRDNSPIKPHIEAIAGFAKSIRKENPNFSYSTVSMVDAGTRDIFNIALDELPAQDEDIEVKYSNGQRYVKILNQINPKKTQADGTHIKHGGVYIITGGAGGLGLIFAQYLAQNYAARLVLSGRSELDTGKSDRLQAIKAKGSEVVYIKGDVSVKEDASKIILETKNRFGRIDGIIHSAGVIRDSFVKNKSMEQMEAVLLPKILGIYNLDKLSKNEDIDFFMVFSSFSSMVGNIGQSDYAYANSFMDSYILEREYKAQKGLRKGKSISVNWPLWKEGGMRVDSVSEKYIYDTFGMKPLQTQNGLNAFETILKLPFAQIAVIEGDSNIITEKTGFKKQDQIPRKDTAACNSPVPENIRNMLAAHLKTIIRDLLKLRPEEIDTRANMISFGFDSVYFTKFSNAVNSTFKTELMPSVFYEYPSLESFMAYFAKEYQDRLIEFFGAEAQIDIENKTYERQNRFQYAKNPAVKQAPAEMVHEGKAAKANEPVAIVGMAGVMPQSENVQEFWENLISGKDLITEIPPDRWNWKEYFGDPEKDANKTNIIWGGFMKEVDKFDAAFFGISPREAELMDPQHRIFLEVVWKAIADAGYRPSSLSGSKTGLFAGVFTNDYQDLLIEHNIDIDAYGTTGTTHTILPNRISYLLNIHGPSEPVNTACSSSLAAIHRAVEAIKSGECDMAIAGGVNLLASPRQYISTSKARMLSADGRCKTFDQSANGYVRSEGAGALLLKPLSMAIKDNDHIYALIKGSSINHGGRVTSLTAPNPNAQTELIVAAWKKAGIDPSLITYIEAHGTGTSLGDPIEVNGLKKAFKELFGLWGKEYPAKAYCGIGAVKSNAGHLESAAGIAGIFKILLSLKHKKIPGNLHFKNQNPYIQLEQSPFYMVNKNTDWEALKDENGNFLPRYAGISSFGFGGSNVHLALCEFVGTNLPAFESQEPQLIILSARSEELLKEYVSSILDYLEKYEGHQSVENPISLRDIAYTLQAGREALDERLAFFAASIHELKEKFLKYKISKSIPEGFYRNSTKSQKTITSDLFDGKTGKEILHIIMDSRDFDKLAKLWVSGVEIDWDSLYPDNRPKRASLPPCPFAKTRYWIDTNIKPSGSKAYTGINAHKLHPMLHENISSFYQTGFSTVFTGDEFFINDHVIGDNRLLPGVAYIEMARAAAELAVGRKAAKIKNIVWPQAFIASDRPCEVLTMLTLNDSNAAAVEFKISSSDSGKTVHSQGMIEFSHQQAKTEAVKMDISQIMSRCTKTFGKEQCYTRFKEMGFNYQNSFQVIEELHTSSNECLARISLPQGLQASFDKYAVHPCIVDGSLQSVIGMVMDDASGLLPFQMGEISIIKELTYECYAHVTMPDGQNSRYNIDIIDQYGILCIRIRDFMVQRNNSSISSEYVCLKNTWVENPALHKSDIPEGLIVFGSDHPKLPDGIFVKQGSEFIRHNNLYYEINPQNPEHFIKLFSNLKENEKCIKNIVFLWPEELVPLTQAAYESKLGVGLCTLFHLTKALIGIKPENKVNLVVPHTAEGIDGVFIQALSGFAKSLITENPNIVCRLIQLDKKSDRESILKIACEELANPQETLEVKYESGRRFIRKLEKLEPHEQAIDTGLLKKNGVYLITGGVGGLGFIFAKHLAEKYAARLILSGRTALDHDIRTKVKELESKGCQVLYFQSDIASQQDVNNLVKAAKDNFGCINGIIHSAGITNDSLLANKTMEEINAVIAPKVYGSLYLDEATKNDRLDFFAAFSSIASVMGNMGQCDYAFANSFLDSFCEMRETLRKNGERYGKTISFNWPLWKDGGMHISEQTEKLLLLNYGLLPLCTGTGIKAFELGMGTGLSQLLVVEGKLDKISKVFLSEVKNKPDEQITGFKAEVDSNAVSERLAQDIIQGVSKILKLEESHIDLENDMRDYGFDSISLTEFSNYLNEKFNTNLLPSIFFEHPTLRSLRDYLLKESSDIIMPYYHDKVKKAVKPDNNPIYLKKPNVPVQEMNLVNSAYTTMPEETRLQKMPCDSVAIIGMAGVLPQSQDLEEFWENLVDGKDMITEIPPERWDWKEYYGDPMTEPNKTNVIWGGFIKDVDKFDAEFFGISPREAELMDPQQRILLETVWSAIEGAGYSISEISGTKTGLFFGVSTNDYFDLLRENGIETGAYSATGIAHSIAANRISYLLNVNGPSESIDTACSSSLVAMHRAVQSILNGECEMAIAGGVNIMVSPTLFIALSKAGMLSPDGRCKTFDSSVNGYVRAEGAGAIFLKPFSKAVADGDHIYGVIKGSAVNHGGMANSLTAPNPNAQAEVIAEAWRKAGIKPGAMTYIEAHGTGTSLGDPIEINGLKKAYAKICSEQGVELPDKPSCGLGSVKTNTGHLETAAGIAGIMKILLSMKNKIIPGNLHFKELNPYIQLEGSPFHIINHTTPLNCRMDETGQKVPIRMGISSFGFGGTNAHIVFEDYCPEDLNLQHNGKSMDTSDHDSPQIIVLSAKTGKSLKEYALRMEKFLRKNHLDGQSSPLCNHAELNLKNIAYTLQVGRDAMKERLAFVVSSTDELLEELESFCLGKHSSNIFYTSNSREKIRHFSEYDEDLNDVIKKWIEKGKLNKVAEFWINGMNVDWKIIWEQQKPKRLFLPTYPFERTRYWFEKSSIKKSGITDSKADQTTFEEEEPLKLDGYAFAGNIKNPDQILENVISAISELGKIDRDKIHSDLDIQELGIDSILMLQLVKRIKDMYAVNILRADIKQLNTVYSIVEYIEENLEDESL